MKWFYYGSSKEEYDSCRKIIDDANNKNAKIVMIIAGFLEIIFGLLSGFLPAMAGYGKVCVIFGVLTLLLVCAEKVGLFTIKPNFKAYGILLLACAFSMAVSVVSVTEKTILFLMIIVLLPVLFVDYAWRMFLFVEMVSVIYCVMVFMVKDSNVAQHDIFNVLCFSSVSLIMQYFVNKSVVKGFISRVQNEQLIKAYEEIQEELLRQARTDMMTGLLNRTYFETRFTEVLSECKKENDVAYMYIMDLDKFKTINDTLGHQEGDRVIVEVANIIKNVINDKDCATRLGGDEYIFVLREKYHENNIENVALSIVNQIRQLKLADGTYAKLSVGGVRISPDKNEKYDDLYKKADIALYEAKKNGGNQIVLG